MSTSNKNDIVRLLKADGFKINQAILDGLDDFLTLVEEENEDLDDVIEEEEEEG